MTRLGMPLLVFTALVFAPWQGDAAQSYFQGKTVTLQVGSGAGGRQDRIARTLAKYLTKYILGKPAFVIQNKPGGQGIPAMLTLSLWMLPLVRFTPGWDLIQASNCG